MWTCPNPECPPTENPVTCIAGGTAFGWQCPLCRGRYSPTHGWSDATRLDATMLVFTGSRERTESEYQDLLHRAGLTLVKTTATASQLSISRPHLPKTVHGPSPRKVL
jgi:hypothetical protein